jgi:hypothetical protein
VAVVTGGCLKLDRKAAPNQPPLAVVRASPEGTLGPGARATLDGSDSSDPEGKPTAEPVAAFDTPDRPQTVIVSLVVSDGRLESAPAYARVVVDFNLSPRADAVDPREVVTRTPVLLTGRGTDPDGDEITGYAWTVAAGHRGDARSVGRVRRHRRVHALREGLLRSGAARDRRARGGEPAGDRGRARAERRSGRGRGNAAGGA